MAQPQTPPPKTTRGNPSMGDIVRSVAVMAVIILALAAVGLFFTRTPDPSDRTVDYLTPWEQAATIATFELAAPGSLPDGWRATSVSFDPGADGRWHVGFLTNDDEYIGLEQTPVGLQDTIADFSPGTTKRGDATVAGQVWQVRKGGKETTFVRRADDVTLLVTGTAPRADLETFIGLLETRTAGSSP